MPVLPPAAGDQDDCVVTVDDVRSVLAGLPRSSEVLVRDRVKFRVGQIVYVAFSQDETEIGFAFPKEERAALVAARPDVFFLHASLSCASTGVRHGSMRLTRTRCASWCWTRGGWSCRSGSPAKCSARQQQATSRAAVGSIHAPDPSDWPDRGCREGS